MPPSTPLSSFAAGARDTLPMMIGAAPFAAIFGTRPEAIKLAPILHELSASPHFEPRILVTAQHRSMLDPMLAFFARVLEFQSQKILRRKLDEDVVEALGNSLNAAARGPFFTDTELKTRFGRSRESLQVVAGMWPRMNLAAPDLRELLERIVRELVARGDTDAPAWKEWIGASPEKLEAAVEVFRRISTGEV